ncbi:MAG: hypothetical protein WKF88_06150 [Ferruginibacter sp.]
MKMKFLLPACSMLIMALASCKKESTPENTDKAATIELSTAQGRASNMTQDANEVLNEAAVSNNFMGTNFTANGVQTSGILSCATVTVTPLTGFPKSIVIDFGPIGCTSPNGVTRKGKILVTLTDSLRVPGSVATMTFDNYFVNLYKKEGTITWTNTSVPGIKRWHRVCQNGKITAPNGNYWNHFGTQDITQTAGVFTPLNLTDDVFSTTGGHTVTNAAGLSRTGTILSALQKKNMCNFIDKGTYQLQGPNHVAIIDYGNGTCDNLATISIDGGAAQTFTLN